MAWQVVEIASVWIVFVPGFTGRLLRVFLALCQTYGRNCSENIETSKP